MIELNKIYEGNCLDVLKTIPDASVDCCVTSPPYWNLRDYNNPEQIGNEDRPEEYVKRIVAVFNEVKRVLKPTGTLWLNLGDSYASGPKKRTAEQAARSTTLRGGTTTQEQCLNQKSKIVGDLKAKDLVGIPWMVAFALRSAGWYLRQDIIWHKPNPMPESVTDRCTKSHEYIFLLSKSKKYYFDAAAIATPIKDESIRRLAQDIENQKGSSRGPGKTNGTMRAVVKNNVIGGKKHKNLKEKGQKVNTFHRTRSDGKEWAPTMAGAGAINDGRSGYFGKDGELLVGATANKKSVWTVTTKPFAEAHFATFSEELIIDCIKAGTPPLGVVLDPFMGAGTTGLVARKLQRKFIGIELNLAYIAIAEKRLQKQLGFFR